MVESHGEQAGWSRGSLGAVCLMVGVLAAGLPGCALFCRGPDKRELLLLVTAHIIIQSDEGEEAPPVKPGAESVKPDTTQVAVLLRVIEADTGFIDGIGIKWQPLAAPEQKRRAAVQDAVESGKKIRAPEEPPVGWSESGTTGWAEKLQRTGRRIQWAHIDKEQLGKLIRAIRTEHDRRASIVTAPRVTLFADQMGNLTVTTRSSFVRDYDNNGSQVIRQPGYACRAIVHIKNQREVLVYLDMAIGEDRPGTDTDFIEAALNPQGPPDSSALYADDPSVWRLDMERICILADMPDGGTVAVRCPDLGGRVKEEK